MHRVVRIMVSIGFAAAALMALSVYPHDILAPGGWTTSDEHAANSWWREHARLPNPGPTIRALHRDGILASSRQVRGWKTQPSDRELLALHDPDAFVELLDMDSRDARTTLVRNIRSGNQKTVQIWSFGIPFRCYQIRHDEDHDSHTAKFEARRTPASTPLIGRRFAAGKVFAAPLLANLVIIGSVLYVASLAPKKCRGVIRRKQGRCAACGYDVGSLKSCPECGAIAA